MKRAWHRHKHHHCHYPAARINDLGMVYVQINRRMMIMSVTLSWTTPTTRSDLTTPLAITEIQTTTVKRNGTVIGTPPATQGPMTFVDTSPIADTDVYTVETTTNDGLVSLPSNPASVVVIPPAQAAAAITDLKAVKS
jgi:hypothetical protein